MNGAEREGKVSRIMDLYRRKKLRLADASVEHCLTVCRHMLQSGRYCLFASQSEDGHISARLVEPVCDLETLTVWIGTNPTLRKVRELRKQPRVTLAFQSESEQANLILYGTIKVDPAPELRRKCWKEEWFLFFPDGPDGDDFVILTFEPHRIEILSFEKNVVVEPFGLRPVTLVKESGSWLVAGMGSK